MTPTEHLVELRKLVCKAMVLAREANNKAGVTGGHAAMMALSHLKEAEAELATGLTLLEIGD